MPRPSPDLLAKWYAKLPRGSDIEQPGGHLRAEQPGGRLLSMMPDGSVDAGRSSFVADHARRLASYEHDQLAAAVWRFPLREGAPGKAGRPYMSKRKQRRVLQLLAAGKSYRFIERKVRVSHRDIARLRREVRQWKDPEDGDET